MVLQCLFPGQLRRRGKTIAKAKAAAEKRLSDAAADAATVFAGFKPGSICYAGEPVKTVGVGGVAFVGDAWSPLLIEIALHYHCCATDFPRMGAPAVDEAIARLGCRGLLRPSTGHEFGRRRFSPTDGLRVWIKAICNVPMPVQKWAMPDAE